MITTPQKGDPIMLTPAGNIHHSKLPKIGEIGYLIEKYERYTNKPIYWHGRKERVIVDSFPLCDNVWPYSHGIHTANFRYLGHGDVVRMSGFWFEAN